LRCGGDDGILLRLGDETRIHEIFRTVRHAAHVLAVVLPVVVARAILRDGATGRVHHIAGGCAGAIVARIVYAVTVGICDFWIVAIRAGPSGIALAEVLA